MTAASSKRTHRIARTAPVVAAVLLQVGLLVLLTPPFVHLTGSRYWTTAGALGGLGRSRRPWRCWRPDP